MSKIKEALEEFYGIEYYESADVKSTRKSKDCHVCNNTIPVGSSHIGFRFYGYDGDWPVFNVCNDCAKEHKEDLYLIEEYEDESF